MASAVAIVGRSNVGKSTMFNRLTRSRDALVDDQPGVTRDRIIAPIEYQGIPILLVDTGGYDDLQEEALGEKIRKQVEKAIVDADRVLFLVDGREGIMPRDEEIAEALRKTGKPVFLGVNKIDGPEHEYLAVDFSGFGFQPVYLISAAHGYGISYLMQDIIKDLPGSEWEQESDKAIRIAVLGRPNVGKSSLINKLLNSERLLVTERPGTTRDSVDTFYNWKGEQFLFIDTAGIRKKSRVKEKIEKFSMIKSLKSLERCHIAVIVVDAGEGISDQDIRICRYALERGKAVVLAVNKWDLVKHDPKREKTLDSEIERRLSFASFVPRVKLSALTGERVSGLLDKVPGLYNQFSYRIGTSQVNKLLKDVIRDHPPPGRGRTRVKILYGTQASTRPPTFILFVNRPDKVHFSYKRLIINQLRSHLGLFNTPIRVKIKGRSI